MIRAILVAISISLSSLVAFAANPRVVTILVNGVPTQVTLEVRGAGVPGSPALNLTIDELLEVSQLIDAAYDYPRAHMTGINSLLGFRLRIASAAQNIRAIGLQLEATQIETMQLGLDFLRKLRLLSADQGKSDGQLFRDAISILTNELTRVGSTDVGRGIAFFYLGMITEDRAPDAGSTVGAGRSLGSLSRLLMRDQARFSAEAQEIIAMIPDGPQRSILIPGLEQMAQTGVSLVIARQQDGRIIGLSAIDKLPSNSPDAAGFISAQRHAFAIAPSLGNEALHGLTEEMILAGVEESSPLRVSDLRPNQSVKFMFQGLQTEHPERLGTMAVDEITTFFDRQGVINEAGISAMRRLGLAPQPILATSFNQELLESMGKGVTSLSGTPEGSSNVGPDHVLIPRRYAEGSDLGSYPARVRLAPLESVTAPSSADINAWEAQQARFQELGPFMGQRLPQVIHSPLLNQGVWYELAAPAASASPFAIPAAPSSIAWAENSSIRERRRGSVSDQVRQHILGLIVVENAERGGIILRLDPLLFLPTLEMTLERLLTDQLDQLLAMVQSDQPINILIGADRFADLEDVRSTHDWLFEKTVEFIQTRVVPFANLREPFNPLRVWITASARQYEERTGSNLAPSAIRARRNPTVVAPTPAPADDRQLILSQLDAIVDSIRSEPWFPSLRFFNVNPVNLSIDPRFYGRGTPQSISNTPWNPTNQEVLISASFSGELLAMDIVEGNQRSRSMIDTNGKEFQIVRSGTELGIFYPQESTLEVYDLVRIGSGRGNESGLLKFEYTTSVRGINLPAMQQSLLGVRSFMEKHQRELGLLADRSADCPTRYFTPRGS